MSLFYAISRLKRNLFLKYFDARYKSGNPVRPSYVVWDCTRRCNLDCIHCGSKGTEYPAELSTEEIKNIIDQLSLLHIRTFQVTGGEPLLRKDLVEILNYAHLKGLNTSVATNGFHINEDKAKLFAKGDTSLIQISIDGSRDIHNYIRCNTESFDKANAAVRLLKQYSGAKINVATTVMPYNINDLENLKNILLSLKIDFWSIGTVMPVGKAKDDTSLFLSKEQFEYLLNFIINSRKELNLDIVENFPYLGKFDKKVRTSPRLCPVGILSCCIGVDGHIRGCPDQPDNEFYREGDLRIQTFAEIWENGFKRYRNKEILTSDKNCNYCYYRKDCFGGCWVMREKSLHCIRDYSD